jgi:DNA-binding protein YbaB
MGFFDQMKQLKELQEKMEETKKRLDTIEVISENEYVSVTATGNRKIKHIAILKMDDKSLLEEKLLSAVNEVLNKAENVLQSEMMDVTKGMLPPGM